MATHYPLHVTGIDVDPAQIELAQSRSEGVANLRFLTVNGTDLPFETGEFDIVATNKVTHHIPNWMNALTEMLRVLKPGGYLIYADLMFPGLVATVGQAIAGRYAGFPSTTAIDAFVREHRLKQIHLSNAPLHFEGVFQKP